jgi:hemoglobin-like flavoprotein
MMILNPKAKESQQQEIEKQKAWLEKVNNGEVELGFNFEARLNIIKSNLWQNIRDLLPEGKQAEVLMSLQKVYLSNAKIDLDKDNLDSAMVWEDTVQGHDYWADIHERCKEF